MKITDIPAYDGPHRIEGVRFRPLRATLGITAFGTNVLELDPHNEGHPEHDHTADGQEELYVVLEGEVWLRTAEGEQRLGQGEVARVGPETTRKLVTRDSGAVILAIGGTPGQAFVPTM